MSEYILEMQGITKTFPGVKALDSVSLRVRPGTIHGVMGENGAGKSTLMKCLLGIYQRNSGTIIYKGREVNYKTVREALADGISMVHQELSPIPERTVMDNVWVGRVPIKWGFIVDRKKMERDTQELFNRIGIDNIRPQDRMKDLSVAKMQMVEIAKAVSWNSSIVIMDEPTSALTNREVESLFKILRDLRRQGVGIIYISHKMDEIFQICDELSIYRDGTFVKNSNIADIDMKGLIEAMVGREVTAMYPKIDCEIGAPVLKVENLTSGKLFRNISFELRRGEILGFAGLVGAGRTEVCETLFGLHPITGGHIYKNGVELRIKSPTDAIRNKFGLITEDRRGKGIFGLLSVARNTVISNIRIYGFPLKHGKIRRDSKSFVEKLNIKTPSLEQRLMHLSGGNQQKVLVARWLLTNPDILIVDEPTRGIDVGAKAEIHSLITQLAGEGKAIILVSSELPEVMGMSDRILVMHAGDQTAVVDRKDFNVPGGDAMLLAYASSSQKQDVVA
ncbi:MAG: sugar ABC transporter ATP-binding protein [Christensenellaceae bacterium]|jgi:methyl-galactoside transport system ATP-binding protein/inositol transport system ATP-binding protein|nr:sugar ABC transporter ATP-binding protein [Christensenellaceae bacterium]